MSKFDSPKGRAIRRQGLIGLGIVLLAVLYALVLAQGHDPKALDKDPTPLMPALVLGGVGTLLVVIARYRWMFHRPRRAAGRIAARGLAEAARELLG